MRAIAARAAMCLAMACCKCEDDEMRPIKLVWNTKETIRVRTYRKIAGSLLNTGVAV